MIEKKNWVLNGKSNIYKVKLFKFIFVFNCGGYHENRNDAKICMKKKKIPNLFMKLYFALI